MAADCAKLIARPMNTAMLSGNTRLGKCVYRKRIRLKLGLWLGLGFGLVLGVAYITRNSSRDENTGT